jgi:cysteine synthase A
MDLLRVLGAEVRPVPPKPYKDPDNYQKIAGRSPRRRRTRSGRKQFDNVVNRQAHYETTARRSGTTPAARCTRS